jgi:2OG-Fe(II) oxygenase superfamily
MVMPSDPQALDEVIVLSRNETRITTDGRLLAEARERFQRGGAVVLRGFLAPSLLAAVHEQIAAAEFKTKLHPASGVEELLARKEATWLFRFLLTTRDVIEAVTTITGADPITRAEVRIYRLVPGTGQQHDWHNDISDNRRLGLSVNLSDGLFEGGNLQIRHPDEETLLSDIRNTGPGDAVIFGIGPHLEHRVLEVSGTQPRVALAGWFAGEPDSRIGT